MVQNLTATIFTCLDKNSQTFGLHYSEFLFPTSLKLLFLKLFSLIKLCFAGKGVPDVLFQSNFYCAPVLPNQIPPACETMAEYRRMGGRITEESIFGVDPLNNDNARKLRCDEDFFSRFPSFEAVSSAIANHQEVVFQQALLGFIDITLQHTT